MSQSQLLRCLFTLVITFNCYVVVVVGFDNKPAVQKHLLASVGGASDLFCNLDNIYILSSTQNRVFRVDSASKQTVIIAGNGQKGFKDGTAANAEFNNPTAIAGYKDLLIVADPNNSALRFIHNDRVSSVFVKNATASAMVLIARHSASLAIVDGEDIKRIDFAGKWATCAGAIKLGTLGSRVLLGVFNSFFGGATTINACNGDSYKSTRGAWYTFVGNGNAALVSTCTSETAYAAVTHLVVYRADHFNITSCADFTCVAQHDGHYLGPTTGIHTCNTVPHHAVVSFCTQKDMRYHVWVYANLNVGGQPLKPENSTVGLSIVDVGSENCKNCSCGVQIPDYCGPNKVTCGFLCGHNTTTTIKCGSGKVCYEGTCKVAASNAECLNATAITTLPFTEHANLADAIVPTGHLKCGMDSKYALWYSVVGNGNIFIATTCTSENLGKYVDTQISVFKTSATIPISQFSSCGQLYSAGLFECVGNNDNGCPVGIGYSTWSFCTSPSNRYFIAVANAVVGDKSSNQPIELQVVDKKLSCSSKKTRSLLKKEQQKLNKASSKLTPSGKEVSKTIIPSHLLDNVFGVNQMLFNATTIGTIKGASGITAVGDYVFVTSSTLNQVFAIHAYNGMAPKIVAGTGDMISKDGSYKTASFHAPGPIAALLPKDEAIDDDDISNNVAWNVVDNNGVNNIRVASKNVVFTYDLDLHSVSAVCMFQEDPTDSFVSQFGASIVIEDAKTVSSVIYRVPNYNCNSSTNLGLLNDNMQLTTSGSAFFSDGAQIFCQYYDTSKRMDVTFKETVIKSVWYQFVGNGKQATITITNAVYNMFKFYVYRDNSIFGSACGEQQCVAGKIAGQVTVCATSGITYYVQVAQYSNFLDKTKGFTLKISAGSTCPSNCDCSKYQCGGDSCGGYCINQKACPVNTSCIQQECRSQAYNNACERADMVKVTPNVISVVTGFVAPNTTTHLPVSCGRTYYGPTAWYKVQPIYSGNRRLLRIQPCYNQSDFEPYVRLYYTSTTIQPTSCGYRWYCEDYSFRYSRYLLDCERHSVNRGGVQLYVSNRYYYYFSVTAPTPIHQLSKFSLTITM